METTGSAQSAALRRILANRASARFLDSHSCLSALIGHMVSVQSDHERREFDGLWLGSLAAAVVRGQRDDGSLSFEDRLAQIAPMAAWSSKPAIFDAECGRGLKSLQELTRSLDALNVAAVCIEDKTGVKVNSHDRGAHQLMAETAEMTSRIDMVRLSRRVDGVLVIARLESLIAAESVEKMVVRALAYESAGADALLVNQRGDKNSALAKFSKKYREAGGGLPLGCILTNLGPNAEELLGEYSYTFFIYANQLVRAATCAMYACAEAILAEKTATPRSPAIASVEYLLHLVDSVAPPSFAKGEPL